MNAQEIKNIEIRVENRAVITAMTDEELIRMLGMIHEEQELRKKMGKRKTKHA